jgi:hypothetical protein
MRSEIVVRTGEAVASDVERFCASRLGRMSGSVGFAQRDDGRQTTNRDGVG